MKELLKRLSNPGTLIGLVGLVGLLLVQFGFEIDLEWLDRVVKTICAIMSVLGLTNDPTTPGVYNPLKKV